MDRANAIFDQIDADKSGEIDPNPLPLWCIAAWEISDKPSRAAYGTGYSELPISRSPFSRHMRNSILYGTTGLY